MVGSPPKEVFISVAFRLPQRLIKPKIEFHAWQLKDMAQHALRVKPGVFDPLRFQEGRRLFQHIDKVPGSTFGYDGLLSDDLLCTRGLLLLM